MAKDETRSASAVVNHLVNEIDGLERRLERLIRREYTMGYHNLSDPPVNPLDGDYIYDSNSGIPAYYWTAVGWKPMGGSAVPGQGGGAFADTDQVVRTGVGSGVFVGYEPLSTTDEVWDSANNVNGATWQTIPYQKFVIPTLFGGVYLATASCRFYGDGTDNQFNAARLALWLNTDPTIPQMQYILGEEQTGHFYSAGDRRVNMRWLGILEGGHEIICALGLKAKTTCNAKSSITLQQRPNFQIARLCDLPATYTSHPY